MALQKNRFLERRQEFSARNDEIEVTPFLDRLQMRNLAYTPIEVEKRIFFDVAAISKFFESHCHLHQNQVWNCLPLIGRVKKDDDFTNALAFEAAWDRRYDKSGTVKTNPHLPNSFLPLLELMKSLPYQEITHAQILKQEKAVAHHLDLKYRDGQFQDDRKERSFLEIPSLYKIVINDELENNTFFVSKTRSDRKQYVRLPSSTNVFCISETRFWHGSDVPKKPKYIVSIFGNIDSRLHIQRLKQSVRAFPKSLVRF